ncbi:MAG: hypothetical protein AAFV46_00130 [Cyanobacteria bacterium J06635_11]
MKTTPEQKEREREEHMAMLVIIMAFVFAAADCWFWEGEHATAILTIIVPAVFGCVTVPVGLNRHKKGPPQ